MQIKNRYKNYFRDAYDFRYSIKDSEKQMKFLYNQLKFINKKVNLNKYKKHEILEIGSGLGALAKLLLDMGFEKYHGIEMDEDVVSFTNTNIGNYFENISLEDFEKFSQSKYTLIFALEVLEHLENPEKGVKSIGKVLCDGGIFIGTSPFPFKKNILADKTHKYCLHPENWKKLFIESGFDKVETYPMSFIPFIWRISKYFNIRIPIYIPFKYFISTTLIIAFNENEEDNFI
jgi:2-polyprenyl-3-methyl-5-hydroxy-6-metoxy-1,4-benzoquinol methylase